MARDLMRENAWMFEAQPTPEEIEACLKTVPAWHGCPETVTMADYQGYVISISQMVGDREKKRKVWRLYTTVAGKIQILHDAHMVDGKLVPVTEEVEIEFKGSIVVIKGQMISPIYGSKFETGTGVTGDGAKGADLTNPIENAMTSWRGRAASALCGAGVLPYTGIASAEEVQTAESRSDMAERGFVMVTNAQAEPEKKNSTATRNGLKSLQTSLKYSDEDLETMLQGYLKSIDAKYDGTAKDYVLEQDIRFLSAAHAYAKQTRNE